LLDERSPGASDRTAAANERGEILRPATELLVERAAQVRADALVDEPAGGREDERHREREHEREPKADRKARHDSTAARNR
jgi:hypothetical protein